MRGTLCQISIAVVFLALFAGCGGQFPEVNIKINCFWCEYMNAGGAYDIGDHNCKDPFPSGTAEFLNLGQQGCFGWCMKGVQKLSDKSTKLIRKCVTRCIPEYMSTVYDEFHCCNDTNFCNAAPPSARLTTTSQRLLLAALPSFVLTYVITGNRYSV